VGNEQYKGSAVSSVVHDCRAEERVNNAHSTVQWNPDPTNSRRTPPSISPCMFLIGFTQTSGSSLAPVGRGSCPTWPSPVATLMELLHKESFLLASNNADYNDVDVCIQTIKQVSVFLANKSNGSRIGADVTTTLATCSCNRRMYCPPG